MTIESNDRCIIDEGIRRLMRCLGRGECLQQVADTPKRVLRAYEEMTAGYSVDVPSLFKVFETESDSMVVFAGLRFTSLCEHHLMPFSGTAAIGYIPSRKDDSVLSHVIGASKSARILNAYAQRFQLQERLCTQIADAFVEHLTKHVIVMLRAKHACMGCRGVKQPDSCMVSTTLRGCFGENSEAREEFYRQVQHAEHMT